MKNTWSASLNFRGGGEESSGNRLIQYFPSCLQIQIQSNIGTVTFT